MSAADHAKGSEWSLKLFFKIPLDILGKVGPDLDYLEWVVSQLSGDEVSV